MLLVNLLQRSGYAVFAADTTQAAYEIMQSEAAIDLLFADLGASGDLASIELAEKAKALLPDLKIFYTSSLAEALAAYGPPRPLGDVIRDRDQAKELLRVIAGILEQP